MFGNLFAECVHVGRSRLRAPAQDSQIWEWAVFNQFDFILTNDADFEQMLMMKGFPPKVIILKMGNQSTRFIAETIEDKLEIIQEVHMNPLIGILEIT